MYVAYRDGLESWRLASQRQGREPNGRVGSRGRQTGATSGRKKKNEGKDKPRVGDNADALVTAMKEILDANGTLQRLRVGL